MYDGTGGSPVPKKPSLDLTDVARRAEENRRAKLRALMWAEGRSDDDSYDEGMEDAF